jgi:hypothetical protein
MPEVIPELRYFAIPHIAPSGEQQLKSLRPGKLFEPDTCDLVRARPVGFAGPRGFAGLCGCAAPCIIQSVKASVSCSGARAGSVFAIAADSDTWAPLDAPSTYEASNQGNDEEHDCYPK